MRAAIYMRVGHKEQLEEQHQAETLGRRNRGMREDRPRIDACVGDNISSLQEFLQKIRAYDRHLC